jgi:4-hydroxy-4-methyl-2-oxoglutarate aldolase
VIARLQKLDSCAISDALDKFGLPSAVSGIVARSTRTRIAGRVVTVKLGVASGPSTSMRHLGAAAVEAADRGDIVVVEQRMGIEAAAWGGILSNAAKERGIAGVIVEGPARDIDEAIMLDFPVYARSTTARTARGRIQELMTGGVIKVGGASVANGDYVIADSSGIVFVPQSELDRVLQAAEVIAAREALMIREIHAGKPVSLVMGASYENMLK